MIRKVLAALIAVGILAAPAVPAAEADLTARVLFIGNSLTYENDLPAMVEAVAAQAGLDGRIVCRGVAKPNYGLEEHWKDGQALRGIQQGGWTHVVLQQGPSSLPESRILLRDYAARFAREARRGGASVLLYGVWPSRERLASFDAVTASYSRAAQDTGGTLVAVGEGWRAAWRREPSLPLYGRDGFHPSPLGTYLAALMFLERLAGVSPLAVPPPGGSADPALRAVRPDARQLRIVQEAAADAGSRVAFQRLSRPDLTARATLFTNYRRPGPTP